MRKVASILNSVDSGELMRDSSVFYVKKTQKQRDIEQKKKKKQDRKRWQQRNFGATLLNRGSYFKVDLDQNR